MNVGPTLVENVLQVPPKVDPKLVENVLKSMDTKNKIEKNGKS